LYDKIPTQRALPFPTSSSCQDGLMIETDDILVERARRGDHAAFEELVRRTSRLVFARLYLETGDSHLAEDLLQETLLTAYRTLGQLTNTGKFRSWMLRIAQNIAIDAARRTARKKRTPELEVVKMRQNALAPVGPDEHVEKEELREQVLAVLRDLPEEYRMPLTLRYLVGADYETIQQQMGLTNGSLRGLLHRGMERLRAEMQKALGE
jgi:RNA polymerase sigma-70 factor (ECF subfamily)